MTEFIEFNLNHYIYVKLTDTGRAELERQHDDLMLHYPNHTSPYIPPNEDKEGFSKFQGHSLINRLGHLMIMGGEPPFDIKIRLENKDFNSH